MRKTSLFLICSIFVLQTSFAEEYHVSVKGDDANKGTSEMPFRTINAAAKVAKAGDVITVHEGTYREWVNPLRGGNSDSERIVYRAAKGDKVEIKGSEIVKGWEKLGGGLWKVILSNDFFKGHNPYKELINGDWFDDYGHVHHTGEVFLNGKSLYERDSLEKVINPVADTKIADPEGSTYTWYCRSDDTVTTIWANFHDYDPNKELVEISVRPTCFYPSEPGINYITIDGFHFSQAATQWAAPTAEQIGMVATHWNKGWIIENNVVSDSKCVGITLGKERSTGHNVWLADPSIDGSLHYLEVIFKAIRHGWNKENIGSHIVRNNVVYNCEQAGICGSMGCAFSEVYGNHIYNIWIKRQFSGAERGGIKFHGAIDTHIYNNRINNASRGMWLDWMTQGTRVSGNLFYNNSIDDIYVEVNHGPYLIDNNILGSPVSLDNQSQGGAYIHNLFAGTIVDHTEHARYTPYMLPHSTDVAGISIIVGGDDRYFNNIFAPAAVSKQPAGKYGLAAYSKTAYPVVADGNVYYGKAKPYSGEKHYLSLPDVDPQLKFEEVGDEVYVVLTVKDLDKVSTQRITTEIIGKSKLARQLYESSDGTPIVFDSDYSGAKRSSNPKPGPFANVDNGTVRIRVW